MSVESRLEYFKNLFENNGANYFLEGGTVWHKYMKQGWAQKQDVDFCVHRDQFYKIKAIIEEKLRVDPDFTLKKKWDKEISFFFKGEQVDIQLYDTDDDNLYIYAYHKNCLSGEWDVEWRLRFPKELYFPKRHIEINGLRFPISNNLKEKFPIHYKDNWKKERSKEFNKDHPVFDPDYRQIAIIIPHFLRVNKTIKEIESIKQNLDPSQYRIYVASQGENLAEETYFKKLQEEGHVIMELPYNCGLSVSRNKLIKESKEPLILVIDNDFVFNHDTRIDKFIRVLNYDREIGIVGGLLSGREAYTRRLYFDQKQKKIIFINCREPYHTIHPEGYDKDTTRFCYTDLVLNFKLCRREVFDDIEYDDHLLLVEHADFFIRLKALNSWKVAFCPEVLAEHQLEGNTAEYTQFRQRKNKQISIDRYIKKMGLRSLRDSNHYYDDLSWGKFQHKTGYENAEQESGQGDYRSQLFEDMPDRRVEVPEEVMELLDLGTNLILMDRTCLDAVRKGSIQSRQFHFGVPTELKKQALGILKHFTNQGSYFAKNGFRVYLHHINRVNKTKPMRLNGKLVSVPFPVVGYLKQTFGNNWERA